MKQALCGTAPEWLIQAFLTKNVKLTAIGTCSALPASERGHIDLMAANIENQMFVAPETEKLFDGKVTLPMILVKNHLGNQYPDDVKLSSLQIGSYFLCRESSLSPDVKEFALQQNLKIINVNQGYVRCSVCVCNENSVITDDPSIGKVLCNQTKLHVLEVGKGSITLPGYPYGFIGGASGKVGDTLYFFGDLQSHSQAESIQNFLNENHVSFHSLSNTHPLTDIGGIISL